MNNNIIILCLFFIPSLLFSCKKAASSSTATNSISATVNGSTINGSATEQTYSVGMQRITINTNSYGMTPGNYLLNNVSSGTTYGASYAIGPNTSNLTVYSTNGTHTGTLIVTNVTNSTLTGTFNFTGESSSGDSITVSNGVLNAVNYTAN
jgi:hypothetical protein